MKKIRIPLILLIAVLSFSTIFTASDRYTVETRAATLSENKKAVLSLENDLGSIQSSLNSIKKNIERAKANKEDQMYIKSQLDQEISLTETKIKTLEKLIEGYNAQIVEKEDQISNKDQSIEDTLDFICERLVMQHESNDANMISYVLGSSDFADLLMRFEIANSLFEYDRQLIEGLTNDRIELSLLKDELEKTRDNCTSTMAELDTAKADLEVKVQEAIDYVKAYQEDADYYQKQYEKKAAEADDIANEIKQLQATIKLQELENYSNEEFRFPLPYDCTYRNSGGWGLRYWNNGRETDFHKGIDFACARGTPIYASNSGTVIIHRNSPSYGLYITIDHGGGVTTLYAHCSELLVNAGDKVTKGQLVAKVGSTGDSTGNHLHFSVLENGVYVDPAKYIKEPK